MANQSDLLNVSGMINRDKNDLEGVGNVGENLCSFSSDETEELYSSSTADTCGNSLSFDEKTQIN